jgi:cell division protein FtsB
MTRDLKYKKINLIGKFRNYILLGVCGVLAISSVIMTIDVSATGAQISALQKKEEILLSENRVLEGELTKTSSVSGLQEKSAELGFVKPTETVYLSGVAPVANIP